MRICSLNRDAWEPGEVVVTLELRADGVRATWHDENFRRWFAEGLAPAVLGDDGELVRVKTPELLYRYAAKLYRRSQTIVVLPDHARPPGTAPGAVTRSRRARRRLPLCSHLRSR